MKVSIPERNLEFFQSLGPLGLGSCRAGMAWKMAKSRKWKKMDIEMENGLPPQAGQGQKWPKNEKVMEFSSLWPFFAIFAPVQLGGDGRFPFRFPFFVPFPAFGHFPCHTSPAGSQLWVWFSPNLMCRDSQCLNCERKPPTLSLVVVIFSECLPIQ